jgi:glycosyltransferase involved in cell wall biosynthesis
VAVETAANGEARATLVGTQADSYIDRLYSVADLFVAPNVPVPGRPEGYGLTPAEAAAAGLPVLVSKLEGLADMAAVTGLGTVEPGDSDAWRLAVEAALADPDSARATKPARSWDDVASEYAALFAEIAREPQIAIRRLNANRPA